MINIQNLSVLDYRDARFALIVKTEGAELRPYADSVGLATIGIGFNLSDPAVFDQVILALFPNNILSSSQISTLRNIASTNFGANNTSAVRLAEVGDLVICRLARILHNLL